MSKYAARFLYGLFCVVYVVSLCASASALTTGDIQSIVGETPYYDPVTCATGQAGASPSDVSVGGTSRSNLNYPSATSLSDASITGAIKKFIQDKNTQSVFLTNPAGADATISALVASAKHANVTPFLAVAIAFEEGTILNPKDYNIVHGNNSFGRTATDSQPHFNGRMQWYKWDSIIASVDYTDPSNSSDPKNGDQLSYLSTRYGKSIDAGDLASALADYAPPGQNDTPKYIKDVTDNIATMTTQAGGSAPTIAATTGTVSGSTPGAPCTCTVSVSTDLSGSDNIQKAFNFLVQQGLTQEQAAGVVGNLMWESSVDPRKSYGGGESPTPNPPNGPWGIAQWTNERITALVSFAQAKNPPVAVDDLGVQLEYLWHELTTTRSTAGDDLKKQTTIVSAATSFFNLFEAAGDATLPNRIQKAQDTYSLYGSGAGTTVTAPASGNDCNATTGPGQNTQYINGFTVYDQCDPAWGDSPYQDRTICSSGCGPSAMAMIITALTNNKVTPVETTNYAASKHELQGGGSSWSIGPDLADHWGLQHQDIGASIPKINAALQAGGLVIAAGMGPEPFTSAGHFLVIRAVTTDGKWLVGDSAHSDANSKKWDPQQLIDSIVNNNGGSVVAITK